MHTGRNYPIANDVRAYCGQFNYPLWIGLTYDFLAFGWIDATHIHPSTSSETSFDLNQPVYPGPISFTVDVPNDLGAGHLIAELSMDLNSDHTRLIVDFSIKLNGVLQASQHDMQPGVTHASWLVNGLIVAPGATTYPTGFSAQANWLPTPWP